MTGTERGLMKDSKFHWSRRRQEVQFTGYPGAKECVLSDASESESGICWQDLQTAGEVIRQNIAAMGLVPEWLEGHTFALCVLHAPHMGAIAFHPELTGFLQASMPLASVSSPLRFPNKETDVWYSVYGPTDKGLGDTKAHGLLT